MSSEAVSTDLDSRAHPRAPLQTLPCKLLVGHTHTHTQIMNQKFFLCEELTVRVNATVTVAGYSFYRHIDACSLLCKCESAAVEQCGYNDLFQKESGPLLNAT